MANFGIQLPVLMENGPQVTFKFFALLCKELGAKKVKTTRYRPPPADMLNVLTPPFRHYVAKHRKDWDTLVFPLTYAYNVQVHITTKLPSISLSIT